MKRVCSASDMLHVPYSSHRVILSLSPRLLAEQERVLAPTNGEITLEALGEMELLHNCMKETLRMHPPLIMLMRKCLEPIQYKGYTIPKVRSMRWSR